MTDLTQYSALLFQLFFPTPNSDPYLELITQNFFDSNGMGRTILLHCDEPHR